MATPKKTSKKDTTQKSTQAKPTEQSAEATASKPAPAAPLIDAAAHAHSAASNLAARGKQGAAAPTMGGTSESAAFKKLKEGLAKPTIGGNSPVGGGAFPKPVHNQNFNKQPNQRQAFNANSNRTGVPRRTAGG